MRIGLNTRDMAAESASTVWDVIDRMSAHGFELLLTPALAELLRNTDRPMVHAVLDPATPLGPDIDLFVGLGGDGTLLDTVALVGRSQIPVLGINLGRLGFLSNVRLDAVDEALLAVKNGRYALQDRSLLEVTDHAALLGTRNFALNEVSVTKRDTASMVAVHVHLGDDFLNTYWADGLIISTPTGSTAYSLSCGGPILHPTCGALVINPISPHNLNVRPFVVPDHYTIRLRLEARADRCLLNLDSHGVIIDGHSTVTIRLAPFTVKLVQLEDQDFLDTLRTKLNWGLDMRSNRPVGGA
jgi:NAD+ kinase